METTPNRTRSVYFKDGNEDYVKELSKENRRSFNDQLNEIVREKKEGENK